MSSGIFAKSRGFEVGPLNGLDAQAGRYIFTLKVTDGNLTAQREVRLDVATVRAAGFARIASIVSEYRDVGVHGVDNVGNP